MKHVTYVMRYQHGSVTVTRHFKTLDEVMRYYRDIEKQASGVQVEKLTTTRQDLTNLLNRLEKVVGEE